MKSKKTLSFVLTIAMLVLTLSIGLGSVTASAITYPDGIRTDDSVTKVYIQNKITFDEIENFLASYSQDELSGVQTLYITNIVLTDDGLNYEGLEYIADLLPNLTKISFAVDNISDISFISRLPKLETLRISSALISDISPITNCPNLTLISFSHNHIKDITPVFKLEKLKTAYLDGNHITNITGLKEYFSEHRKHIQYFKLDDNPLADQIDYLNSVYDNDNVLSYEDLYMFLTESDFRPLIYDDVTVDNETYTITVNSREGASYVAINNVSASGNVNFTVPKVEGKAELYVPTRYKFPKPADSNTYTTTLEAGSNKLAPVTYTLIVNFIEEAKPTFEADKLTIKNATNTSFDAENSALTIDSDVSYVRIYKALTNGSTVSVDAEKYGFITEYDNFYQINKNALAITDLNIASFDVTTDSGDTITTTVNFPGAGELPFTKLFKITNYDSLTQEENVINLDIVDTKTFSVIYKDVADGTTLTIESDSTYVEERADCYVLRQRAVGETITMTYGDTTYTINLTK